jgi:hypothetical protein
MLLPKAIKACFPASILLILVIISGCISQTGNIAKENVPVIFDEVSAGENISVNQNESGLNLSEEEPGKMAEENRTGEVTHPNPQTSGCFISCSICEVREKSSCACIRVNMCCGNKFCEINETSVVCEADCPNRSLVFYEVMYDAKTPENKKEWFEIYNPTGGGFDMTGYSISDNDFEWKFPEDVVINPKEYVTIARDDQGFYEEYGCHPDISGFTRTLNNEGDQLILKDRGGVVIDAVYWREFSPGWIVSADEGMSIKRTGEGRSPADWSGNRKAIPHNCSITCGNFTKTCEDGYISSCESFLRNDDCTSCEPDCSGHGIKIVCEESWICSGWSICLDGSKTRSCSDVNSCNTTREKPEFIENCTSCSITCGSCQETDIQTCVCLNITPCSGNSQCEYGEYGISSDCPDCNDENQCTDDYYNYTSQSCHYHETIPCCGNGICEEEENLICAQDCGNFTAPPQNVSLHIMFTEVGYDVINESVGEWIEIYNPSKEPVNLSGWMVEDNSESWEFPQDFFINANSYVTVGRNYYEFFTMFGCNPGIDGLKTRLSNTNDQLFLKNPEGKIIDFVAWGGKYNKAYPEWTIHAGENKTIARNGFLDRDAPSDWMSEQNPGPAGCG